MSESSTCPRCGNTLPPETAPDACPKCLIGLGLAHSAPGGETLTSHGGSRSSAPPPAEIAPDFPQLEILEVLGQGGMGVVYKARQKSLDRIVALKILAVPPTAGPDFAERFTREARALASLSHPSIVTVHDFGRAGERYFLIMEFVDGANLHHVIRGGSMRPRQALEIVSKVCDALQYAHDSGVVHRDIKPENILVDRHGRVKIADFGLAKMLGGDGEELRLTGARQVMGTAHYMAPEQLEHPLEVDHRADIYSLGVVFYELLTGELPLGRFPPPSSKIEVDVRVDEVVLKALEKEPQRRYQTAGQVKTEVDHLSGAPVAGGSSSVWRERVLFGLVGVLVLAVAALVLLIWNPMRSWFSPASPDVVAVGATSPSSESGVSRSSVASGTSAGASAGTSAEAPTDVPGITASAGSREAPAVARTPLLIAASRGQRDLVGSLLGSGADVNARGPHDTTALIEAADNGRDGTARLLLEHGADANAARADGTTPLIIATRQGHTGLVEALLQRGAAPNARGRHETTPLLEGVDNGRDEAVRLLLDSGADVNVARADGTTPLIIAARQGHTALVEAFLARGADLSARGRHDTTALLEALDNGRDDITMLLLDRGADANGARADGTTPLIIAARLGRSDVVNALIERGADVNAKGRHGTTALVEAVDNGRDDVAQMLLRHGAR